MVRSVLKIWCPECKHNPGLLIFADFMMFIMGKMIFVNIFCQNLRSISALFVDMIQEWGHALALSFSVIKLCDSYRHCWTWNFFDYSFPLHQHLCPQIQSGGAPTKEGLQRRASIRSHDCKVRFSNDFFHHTTFFILKSNHKCPNHTIMQH